MSIYSVWVLSPGAGAGDAAPAGNMFIVYTHSQHPTPASQLGTPS